MKLLLVFLPLLAHVLFGRVVRRAPVVTTALAAAASLAITLIVVMQSPVWPEAYRIAWLGVSTKANNRLVIGGPSENSVCGWPNEALAPAMSIVVQPDKSGVMFVEGGGAFVFVRGAEGGGTWEPVNGLELKAGEDSVFEDALTRRRYVFCVRPDGWLMSNIRFRLTIHAEGPQRHLLADVPLRCSGGDGNVTGLAPLLELSTATLGGTLAERIALRTWAGGLRIFVPRSRADPVRVIEPEATAKVSIPLPCETIVRWAGNSPVKAALRFNEGVIKCDFLRPWWWTSPLPPRTDTAYPMVTLCAQPQPKDHAFLLPLGRMTAAMRVDRELRVDDSNKLALLEPISTSSVTLIPTDAFAPPVTWSNEQTVISKTTVSAGDYDFDLGIIYDLPGFLGLVGCALPAFGIFLFALWITNARMGVVEESRAAAFGLALSLWVFLCVRLLLALRYALEPAHVDRVAVEGVITAYLGLTGVPALVLLFARLAFLKVEPSPDDRGPRLLVVGLGAAWLGAIVMTWWFVGYLWPSWPVDGWRFAGAIAMAAGLGAILCGMLDYNAYIGRSDGLRRILVGWCRPIVSVLGRLWQRIFDEGKGLMSLIVVVVTLIVACSAFGVAFTIGSTREASEEILIPVGCIWLPVVFWLVGQARAAANPDRVGPRTSILFGLVILFVVAPIAMQVVLSRDAGTAYAAFAAFFSLACVLWVMRPRRLGWAVLATIVILTGAMVVAAYKTPAAFDRLGEAGIRIRSFVRGDELQIEYLFGRGIPANENASGVKADKILNVRQHTWENFALAHEGGGFGMGFGEAPVRRSHVPMQTVQCDSVFSFYVLSEHGLAGGLALLLASLAPLFYLLRAARPRFDVGFGIAFVVAGAFVIETFTQAAMNLGLLPFTGRNLPMLAVISPTDLAKWTLLFAVAVRALFLRYDRDGSLNPDAVPLSSPENGSAFESALPTLVAVGLPIILVGLVVWADVRRIADKELDNPFTWDKLEAQVRELQKRGYVGVDSEKHTLVYNEAPPNQRRLNLDDNRLLLQEIERFNQLPEEERYQERGIQDFRHKLEGLADTRGYDTLMDELRKKSSARKIQTRPPVFEMHFVADPRDEDERQVSKSHRVSASKDGEIGEWEIRANGDFNSQLHFKRTPQQTQLPELEWRGSRRTGLLLGPAWAMGKNVIAYDPDAPVPWLAQLAEALRQEWSRIGADAGTRFKRLTLSPDLQDVALDFVARKGRAHHADLLAAATQRKSSDVWELRERIPPRVALSILNLAPKERGEVVALGGWPRTTSRPFWQKSNSGEWLPPAQWLEKNAPESLKRRYLGDRNFDLMLMGSASKPIFAAAALAAQPGLDKRLHTKGGEDHVDELFGTKVADRAWNESWHGGPEPWRNFDNYLAYSDNRYHIRLGFLALAERDGDTIAKAAPVQSSVVSLDSSPIHHPWLAFPKFPPLIGLSQGFPTRIEKLNETQLAAQLKAFFPIGITTGELRRTRLSFWTGNEGHDVSGPKTTDGPLGSAFDRISPQAVRFDLDRVGTTRGYIMVLLGGLTNTWANVDFAGAFGTTVLGRPVVPHIIAGDQPPKPAARKEFVSIAERLRPGLKGVVRIGTASRYFANGKESLLDRWTARGYELYAKTGTLEEDDVTKRKTSRLVFALVRWNRSKPAEVQSGLVFSLVTEHAATGTATSWLHEFIANNDAQIKAFLDYAE